MLKILRGLSVLIAMAALSACATLTIPPERVQTIHKISVASLLTDDFYYYYYGFMVFTSEHDKINISHWRLNEYVNGKAGQLLAANFEITAPTKLDISKFDSKQFDDLYSDSVSRRLYGALEKPADAVDAFVLVVPENQKTMYQQFYYFVDNVGVMRRLKLGLVKATKFAVYAAYRIAVYDGKSGELIVQKRVVTPPGLGAPNSEYPLVDLPGSDDWTHSLPEIMRDHREEIERQLKSVIDSTLEQTFREIGLLPKPQMDTGAPR